jgi:hypothetical protein
MKEYVAILLAVQQQRSYLQLGEFVISTDQKSISHLNDQRLHTPWQQKVFTKLLGLNYRVVYKKEVDNRAANALSHRPLNDSHFVQCQDEPLESVHYQVVSSCQPRWVEEV